MHHSFSHSDERNARCRRQRHTCRVEVESSDEGADTGADAGVPEVEEDKW